MRHLLFALLVGLSPSVTAWNDAMAQATPAPAAQEQPAAEAPTTAAPSPSTTPDNPETAGGPATTPSAAEPPNQTTLAPEPISLTLPHDLSPWGMFISADIIVKTVMIGLAFASFVTWTVWLAKTLEIAGARRNARRALRSIADAATLTAANEALERRRDPASLLVHAAREEVMLSAEALDRVSGEGLKERVGSRLARIEAAAGRRMSRGTGILATIGSTAPFVGLFGTVWGIMNAFIGISEAQTTNLAVVAPGIAEALLATALGLVAAIPAVVIYNLFARSITGYRQILADASAAIERLVSRDLDFRTIRPTPKAAAQIAAE